MSQCMNFQFGTFMLVFVRYLREALYARITTQKEPYFTMVAVSHRP